MACKEPAAIGVCSLWVCFEFTRARSSTPIFVTRIQAAATVQRPLFGPPANSEPGPTGQVVVMGQPYYKEA